MSRLLCLLLLFLAWLAASASSSLVAQPPQKTSSKRVVVRAGHLFDGKSDALVSNVLVAVEDGKIASVTPGGSAPSGVELIDLSHATVLPGFVDAHTHILLQGDITDQDYDAQLLKQSIP